MAGDWIKMRVNLADDPAVIGIADALDMCEDHVVGKLHRLWSWADQQTADGLAPGVTSRWVDRYVSAPGFADAMIAVGWLTISEDGLEIPNFDTHNGRPAKKRAVAASRQKKHRSNAGSVTKPLPEKRREEKRREKGGDPPPAPRADLTGELETFAPLWDSLPPDMQSGRRAAVRAHRDAVVSRGASDAVIAGALVEQLAIRAKAPADKRRYFGSLERWFDNDRWTDTLDAVRLRLDFEVSTSESLDYSKLEERPDGLYYEGEKL